MRRSAVIFTHGFTLIEVLVTLVISASALFGFVELQNRVQITNIEVTQRAYATMIASNMIEQIKANPGIGADCNLTASFDVGQGHGTWDHPCTSGSNSIKEWHKDLRGVREKIGNARIGGIKNGHGCIYYTPAVPATGTPAKYTVSVAWKVFIKLLQVERQEVVVLLSMGDSGYHRLVSLDVYPLALPGSSGCSEQPPTATINVQLTQAWVVQPSRILSQGQVLHISGTGQYIGSLVVRSGRHVVVSGS